MAASWPSAKKTFSAVINGVTKLIALLFNSSYDEVEALQTFIGAPGAAQTHLAALLDMMKDGYAGGRCYKKDADEIYVGPFAGIIANAAGTVKKLRISTSVTTLSAANLDTGSFAALTYYYIYATADSAATTPTFVISASASAPTGYTYYRRLGWFYNETINVLDITGGKISTFIGGDNDNQIINTKTVTKTELSATAMPMDDSIPTWAEGAEIADLATTIIPSSATNKFLIRAIINCGSNGGQLVNFGLALFKDPTGTDAAIAASVSCPFNNSFQTQIVLEYLMTTGGTSPTTFKLRTGNTAGNAFTINGANNIRVLGGVMVSSLTVTEIKA